MLGIGAINSNNSFPQFPCWLPGILDGGKFLQHVGNQTAGLQRKRIIITENISIYTECSIEQRILIVFLHQFHLLSIKSCILGICYDHLSDLTIKGAHNITHSKIRCKSWRKKGRKINFKNYTFSTYHHYCRSFRLHPVKFHHLPDILAISTSF